MPVPPGFPNYVSTGTPVTSTWGNQVVNQLQNMAWGTLTWARTTVEYGNGSAAGEYALLITPPVTFTEGRRLRVSMCGTYRATVVGDQYQLKIRRGTGIGGALVAMISLHVTTGGQYEVPFSFGAAAEPMTAAAGGTTQWVFTIQRTAGTGNLSILGTDTSWNELLVEDVGPITRM